MTVSVLGLAALIGLLAYFNGRDQRTWHTGTAITLNAVVAAIATVTKSSLVFVISSCLGQAMWNWYAMPRQGSRRSSRHGRPLKDMQDLDEASRGTYGSLLLLVKLRSINLATLGAILTILSFGFDFFAQQILGSDYRNVDGAVGMGAGTVPRAEMYDGYLPQQRSLEKCIYGLPSGVALIHGADTASDPPIFQVNVTTYTSNPSDIYNDPSTNYLTNFQMIGATQQTITSEDPTPNDQSFKSPQLRNVHAYDCALWWCLQCFSVSVDFGHQATTNETHSTMSWTSKNVPSAPDTPNAYALIPFTSIPSSFNIAPRTTYGVTWAAVNGAQHWLFQSLGGSIGAETTVSYVYEDATGRALPNDLLTGAWVNAENPFAWIQGVALSISNMIRAARPAPAEAPGGDKAFYTGRAAFQTVYWSVRWGWIAYPAAMVVGGLVYFLLTLLETRRLDVMAWKSNPLALLFSGVDGGKRIDGVEGAMDQKGGLKKRVGGVKVMLGRQGGRWCFR
ncbi:MAG: hypothetical protein Q9160_001425 [Pyrenula sp. 1 TL-2023]